MPMNRLRKAVLATGLSVGALAAQDRGPLTNQRVSELVAAGVSTQEILRVVAAAPKVDFNLQPTFTDALLKAGVSEEVIKAMAARESGGSLAAPAAFQAPVLARTIPVTTAVLTPAVKSAGTATGVLYQGTPIRMRIMHTVSSADAQVDNKVDFQTLDDIRQSGIVVIPKGSMAIATITTAESKKRMGRGGKLGMNIDYVRMPNGDQLPLRGVQNLKGGGHTGAMTGAMVATAIVFWPASPLFLFMHGKDVVIPEGHEVTVYTNSDYTF